MVLEKAKEPEKVLEKEPEKAKEKVLEKVQEKVKTQEKQKTQEKEKEKTLVKAKVQEKTQAKAKVRVKPLKQPRRDLQRFSSATSSNLNLGDSVETLWQKYKLRALQYQFNHILFSLFLVLFRLSFSSVNFNS